MRRRFGLVELDDGSGGLAGLGSGCGGCCWAFVEEAEVVVACGGGGGSGSDDKLAAALGFDLDAAANSAGNGFLLAAMPQAYSISNLKPWTGLSFFLLRRIRCAEGWYCAQQTPRLPVSSP